MYNLPPGLPPLEDMKRIAEEFKEKGTRDWDRDEEMRKAEAEIRPHKIDFDKYQVNLEGYCPYVSAGIKNHIIKLIYRMNFIQFLLDHKEYESCCEIRKLKRFCMDLYNRIPPNQRPLLPENFNLF